MQDKNGTADGRFAGASDEAPLVLKVASSTCNNGELVGFSLASQNGPINFSVDFELLGEMVSQALIHAQKRSKSMRRTVVPGGAVLAQEIIPETIAVSHGSVCSEKITRIVIVIGDFSLAFLVDQSLASAIQHGLENRSASLKNGPSRIIFPTRHSKRISLPRHEIKRKPTSVSALPLSWSGTIGSIILQWADFEQSFDYVISRLLEFSPTPALHREWRLFKFGERRSLFLKLWRRVASRNPEITRYVEGISADAASIYSVRNLLTHGQLHGEVVDDEYTLRAYGLYKGKQVEASFGKSEVNTLYYDICHLCGRINYLIDPCEFPEDFQMLSLEDVQFLISIFRNPE